MVPPYLSPLEVAIPQIWPSDAFRLRLDLYRGPTGGGVSYGSTAPPNVGNYECGRRGTF